MNIKQYKIKDLTPYSNNPRINDQAINAVAASIQEFGFKVPIVVDKNNVIITGHTRLKAAKKLGMKEVPVILADDLTPDQVKAFRLADNKTGELAIWDFEKLEAELDEIDMDMEDFGFDEVETETEGLTDEDEVPEDVEPVCQLGQLWTLGRHRLLCGDAYNKDELDLLMDGKKVDMVFTDPPYGISVVGKNGNIGKGVLAKEGTYRPVIGDDKDYDPSHLFGLSEMIVVWGANYFSNKLPRGQWIVWDKDRPEGTTFSDCELAWTNRDGIAVKKYKCTWNGMVREGESGLRFHPTQKPIKVCVEIISDFSDDSDIVLDLFLGSGSTLIAAEKTNRKCYGMEIDPHYCDVIIKRWEDFTGNKSELIK